VTEDVSWIAVGRITRAHGVRGEVAVLPLSQVESRFEPGSKLLVDEGGRPLTVAGARPHRNRLLVSFEEVRDRDQAEAIRGRYLFVHVSTAPSLPEGEYWTHELIGSTVETAEGRHVGVIREIIHTPANDVWVASRDGGEVLIPALKDVVESVDLVGRRIVIREVEGLTAL
jgi:16S rRNA processing protein RimM